MYYFNDIVAFIAGCIIGSFINVCIYRIPRGKSIISPPSACTGCNNKIKPWNNIPLISFAILKGKCSNCGDPISLRYPAVELMGGLLTLAVYRFFGLEFDGIAAIFLVYLLLIAVFIDIDFQIIPDWIIVTGIAGGVIIHVAGSYMPWQEILSGALAGSGFLLVSYIIGKLIFRQDSVGGGDIKLGFMIGMYLGFQNIIIGMFASFVFAAIIEGSRKALSGRFPTGKIPFGPYIALGSLTGLFFGNDIKDFYFAWAGF